MVRTAFPVSEVALPFLRNHQDVQQQEDGTPLRRTGELERQLSATKSTAEAGFFVVASHVDQNLYCAEMPYRSACPSNGPARCVPRAVMSTRGASGLR